MIISTTELRVKDLLEVALFFRLSKASVEQARRAPGNLQVSVRGTLLSGMTLTAWKDETSMMAYRNSGAMQSYAQFEKVTRRYRTIWYEADGIPNWKRSPAKLLQNLSESFKKRGNAPVFTTAVISGGFPDHRYGSSAEYINPCSGDLPVQKDWCFLQAHPVATTFVR